MFRPKNYGISTPPQTGSEDIGSPIPTHDPSTLLYVPIHTCTVVLKNIGNVPVCFPMCPRAGLNRAHANKK